MKKVIMLKSVSGPGINLRPGQEHAGEAKEMQQWVNAGYAKEKIETKKAKNK